MSADNLTLLSAREHFEERAAILEFDAGMSRSDAEAAAIIEVTGVFGQSVADAVVSQQ